mmetsp:Transcript_119319/g.334221  ORF Transcript_119319/g.334221 Transcript_119319/m.334221 type:complete len:124 (-) Transcript_119319:906-1277(-)
MTRCALHAAHLIVLTGVLPAGRFHDNGVDHVVKPLLVGLLRSLRLEWRDLFNVFQVSKRTTLEEKQVPSPCRIIGRRLRFNLGRYWAAWLQLLDDRRRREESLSGLCWCFSDHRDQRVVDCRR